MFGVGGIFFALNLMGDAVEPLKSVTAFKDYLATLGNRPIMGVIIGAGLTMLIQSSAATIGILQSLYSGGLLDLQGALPILFGDNIGTTITAVLAALGSNIAAKRVAGAHVLFNVIGTVLCLILLVPFTALIQWFKSVLGLTPEMTIAFAHGTFNIANTIVQFPFIGVLAYLVTKIIPGEDEINKYEALYLDRLLITQAPAIALGNAKKELVLKMKCWQVCLTLFVTWSVLVTLQLQVQTFHNTFIIRELNSLILPRLSLRMFTTVLTASPLIVFVWL